MVLFLLFLSEPGPHSDAGSAFSSFTVRIQGSFGHWRCFFSFSCPNTGLIRTLIVLFLPFLSEYRAHSDTGGAFSPFPVRIQGSFGHWRCFFSFSCPNQALIRTLGMVFLPFLSESDPHSDTGSAFSPFPVRIQGSFGHWRCFFSFSCPNQTLIRTLGMVFLLFLSESDPHSDTGSAFSPFMSESSPHSDTGNACPHLPV
jgi:hypothetical protein